MTLSARVLGSHSYVFSNKVKRLLKITIKIFLCGYKTLKIEFHPTGYRSVLKDKTEIDKVILISN